MSTSGSDGPDPGPVGDGGPERRPSVAFGAVDASLNCWVYLDSAVPTWVRIAATATCLVRFAHMHRIFRTSDRGYGTSGAHPDDTEGETDAH